MYLPKFKSDVYTHFYKDLQGIPFTIKTILIWNHDNFDCHREWNCERAAEMCRDLVFVRFHLLAFHFSEFRTCWTQPHSIFRQTVEGSLGFAQTIKTNKVDRWFGLISNQDCNRTKGTSFIAMEPHFGSDPDCFDYERNAMLVTGYCLYLVKSLIPNRHPFSNWFYYLHIVAMGLTSREIRVYKDLFASSIHTMSQVNNIHGRHSTNVQQPCATLKFCLLPHTLLLVIRI